MYNIILIFKLFNGPISDGADWAYHIFIEFRSRLAQIFVITPSSIREDLRTI
jgi:hypothetical protein